MIIYLENLKIAPTAPELSILFGLRDSLPVENYSEFGSRFSNKSDYYSYDDVLEYCKLNFKYSNNLAESDLIVLPHKFNSADDILYQKLAGLNKKLYCFAVNDINLPTDYTPVKYNLLPNIILYRTDFYSSLKHTNERVMIPTTLDIFNGKYIESPKLSVSFCGDVTVYKRKHYLELIKNSDIPTEFIYRHHFHPVYPPHIQSANKKEFRQNMLNHIFSFACRGDKNWSYRFYEIFMMGRIPIFINTDCVLPHDTDIDYKKQCVFIEESEIKDDNFIITQIKNYYNRNKDNLLEIQKTNRMIYEKYFSVIGILENIKKDIQKDS